MVQKDGGKVVKRSIQTTIIGSFILFIAIPIIVTNILMSITYKKTIHGNYASQIEKSIIQLKTGIDEELKRVSHALAVVANDKELMNLFEQWNMETNTSERFSISSSIDRQLNYIFSFNSDVNGLVVFYKDGSHYYYRNDLIYSVPKFSDLSWYISSGERKGFVEMIGTGGSYIWNQTKNLTWQAVIAPKTITLENNIERIYLDMNSPLLNAIKNEYVHDRRILLVDQNKKVLMDTWGDDNAKSQLAISTFENMKVKKGEIANQRINDDYYMSKINLNHNKWFLLFVEPMDEITKDVKQLLSSFYLIYLIVATSFSIYIFIFYSGSIRPIRQLVSKMKSVETGNLNVTTEVEGPSEIRELNTTFNHMMKNIKELIVERDQKEKERSAEEIKALQAQINPHFIYNTLNTIKLIAMMTKAHSIQKMIESFMKVIELNFKVEGSLLTIEEEMAYIDAYVYIMKARYGSFFEIDYSISDDVKSLKIMKMLIQPFIENAIIHGMQSKQDGFIKVSAYQEKQVLVVEILDNGIGMEQEQIDELLNREKSNFNHIGISNVKRRIELTYGSDYTVHVESSPDVYTKIVLRLPLITDGGQTLV